MLNDLSNYHHLISDLFNRPNEQSDWDLLKLTAEQIDFYRENGYLAGLRLLTGDHVEATRLTT